MENFVAELIGTTILVLLGNGVVANALLGRSKGQNGGWVMITTGWGLAVAVAIYSVGRISGAHINPAVTLGLWSIGQLPVEQVPWYLGGQMAGAFLGAVLVWVIYAPHWRETPDPELIRGTFCTAPAIRSPFSNLVTEAIATAVLVFCVLAIAENAGELAGYEQLSLERAYTTALNPLLVGLLVWAIGLSLGGPTGYAINPARDLGPRLAHALLPISGKGGSDWSYSWIPVVGPILGGIGGAELFVRLLR